MTVPSAISRQALPLAYHACAVARSEVLVFRSLADCNEALETMQANAP